MNILDNELVKKYFGCTEDERRYASIIHSESANISERILQAMQEPLKVGDKVLQIYGAYEIQETEMGRGQESFFHGSLLRLPDRFQKRECCLHCGKPAGECKCLKNMRAGKCWCGNSNKEHQPQPDAVEEKITEICQSVPFFIDEKTMREQLINLVRIARETK